MLRFDSKTPRRTTVTLSVDQLRALRSFDRSAMLEIVGKRKHVSLNSPAWGNASCVHRCHVLRSPTGKVRRIQSRRKACLANRCLTRKRHSPALEPYPGLRQLNQVGHVGQVVANQLLERRLVASPVKMPEPNGFKAVHTLDCRIAVQPQPIFNDLKPALVPQGGQHEPQGDMGLIQPSVRKVGPQKGHVELAAVESDQKREALDVGWELLQVDALDKQ